MIKILNIKGIKAEVIFCNQRFQDDERDIAYLFVVFALHYFALEFLAWLTRQFKDISAEISILCKRINLVSQAHYLESHLTTQICFRSWVSTKITSYTSALFANDVFTVSSWYSIIIQHQTTLQRQIIRIGINSVNSCFIFRFFSDVQWLLSNNRVNTSLLVTPW